LREEFGLDLPPERLVWRRVFPWVVEAARVSVFFGGFLIRADVAAIRFGDEGQGWELMPVRGFLSHPRAIPEMQWRAGIVWDEIGGARARDGRASR
jgi:8-oxo-dGTP diphosphatase